MNDEIDKSQHQKKSHTVTGKVISDKMDKTVSVAVERKVKHPLYGKYMRRTSKYIAHDEDNSCRQGDIVKIEECRPVSKTKSWRFVEVIEQGNID
ncbi:MAG: 30S ribosomal protein S17 [Pseudomonadota bacterium]|nr:30S ribosomal protein S17 [Pseudomonadota bacterium]